MVTHAPAHLRTALQRIAGTLTEEGPLSCPVCGASGLTKTALWTHLPLYHTNAPTLAAQCQQCARHTENLAVHVHNHHGPPGHQPEVRTGVFALVVVWRPSDNRFLLVQEVSNWGLWLPGGGLDHGETLTQGAVRECLEEAGVAVKVTGLLALEAGHGGRWLRAIFLGEPLPPDPAVEDSQAAKTLPDFESCGAVWVDAHDLEDVPLRNASELRWLEHVLSGGKVLPLEMPADWKAVFKGWEL